MMSAWKLWAVSNLWSRRGNSPQPKGASKHSQFLPGVKDNLRALRGETGPFPSRRHQENRKTQRREGNGESPSRSPRPGLFFLLAVVSSITLGSKKRSSAQGNVNDSWKKRWRLQRLRGQLLKACVVRGVFAISEASWG